MDAYQEFLKSKVKLAPSYGVTIDPGEVNAALKPHQQAMVRWMVEGGRRACFAAFGLGKSVIQLETLRLILQKTGGRALVVCPLAVAQEFRNDAASILGWESGPPSVRRIEEVEMDPGACGARPGEGIYITNYETVRDGKLDPRLFDTASLDEAAVLRGFGGTKTFREFMGLFAGDYRRLSGNVRGKEIAYRFVATATPSPNDYIELLAYAAFLGIMDVGQAKTRFFKRDSTKADKLTLHKHKEREFWLWVASWALFVTKPSDLGFDDTGYDLPELDVRWHEVPTDHRGAGADKSGQFKMFRDAAIGVQDAAAEKRNSLSARIAKMMEIRAEEPEAHRILWHDLEAERHAIEEEVPGVVSVYGSQHDDDKEQSIINFARGHYRELAAKPCMLGAGVNLQRHCSWAIFLGIGFKFNDFIQAIHRIHRFLQTERVRIDLIYTEAEREVRRQLERKWEQHNSMVQTMTRLIREFGLSRAAMAHSLTRKLGVERVEVKGERYTLVNNDCVVESKRLADNSIHLALSSWPFSTQYEYSPSYNDFGHNEGNTEFFQQLDFLTPEIYRALMPGRIYAVHVKDRIVPGGMTGLGFQTVYPFHMHAIAHMTKHGFGYMGMKTIVTDVVRENNQTYRLGWTEQCKDGTKMGVGMPEYLLLFRKPPTDASDGYADLPVAKHKARYTRGRWQVDAHGFTRSSGNRLFTPGELMSLSHAEIFRMFRDHSLETVYNFEHHVSIGDELAICQNCGHRHSDPEMTCECGCKSNRDRLPATFMLLQPQSWSDEVWTDITRMLTLNGAQSAVGKEMHLCPMQFDLADRVIEQFSMPGETVLDPFGGLMTVPYRAILKGRKGIGFELSPAYFVDGCAYCKAAEDQVLMPDLFSVSEPEAEAVA